MGAATTSATSAVAKLPTQQQKDAARQRYQSASPEQRQAVREKMQTNPQIQQRREAARERIQAASPEQRQSGSGEKIMQTNLLQPAAKRGSA